MRLYTGAEHFFVPSGSAGKKFVREITRLMNAYAQSSAMESIAFDAIMVACHVLLQNRMARRKLGIML